MRLRASLAGQTPSDTGEPTSALCYISTLDTATRAPSFRKTDLLALRKRLFEVSDLLCVVALHGWLIGSIGSIGFVVAGVIGRLSDCYGRRSLIIAQKLSSLICLAALAFRTELNNNLWVYIGLGVASNAITGGRYGGTTVWNACKQLEEILSNQAPDRIDDNCPSTIYLKTYPVFNNSATLTLFVGGFSLCFQTSPTATRRMSALSTSATTPGCRCLPSRSGRSCRSIYHRWLFGIRTSNSRSGWGKIFV
jgi:hypothetical protein